MGYYRIAETLDEALDRCEVIIQTKTGFIDYAKVYEETDMMLNHKVVAFIDDQEYQLKCEDYGKTWRCLVVDLPPLDEIAYMIPF